MQFKQLENVLIPCFEPAITVLIFICPLMSNLPINKHLMTLPIRTEFLKYYHLVEQYKRAVNPIVDSGVLKSKVPTEFHLKQNFVR